MLFSQRKRTAKTEFNVDQKISYRAVLTRKKRDCLSMKKNGMLLSLAQEKKKEKTSREFQAAEKQNLNQPGF